jgi:alanyl-tRNA synthetase
MAELLYYLDAYQFHFQAKVIKRMETEGKFGVILDQTCFYPEGGGQPSDQGVLNDIQVTDVRKINNEIIHFISEPLISDEVQGKVDSEWRLEFMQQHTGQHILSQALLRIGKCNTVSVHFGDTYTAIETDCPNIPVGTLKDIEKCTNDIINENVPINLLWVDPNKVEQFNIRRPPPDVRKVRIVQIENFDAAACGGLHVARTGEVGLIKITGQEKIRGHARIHAMIGHRAFKDYTKKTELLQELGTLLTCGEHVMVKRIQDLMEQLKQGQREIKKLQSERLLNIAERSISQAVQINQILFIHQTLDNADHKILKIFIEKVLAESGHLAAVFGKYKGRLNWMIGHSLPIRLNLKDLIEDLLPIMDAQGGGNPTLVQGSGNKPAEISNFIDHLIQKLERIKNSDE